MNQDRTGQVWEYSAAGVFLVTGRARVRVDGHDSSVIWMDHPILWLHDRFSSVRAGRVDGFIEYQVGAWESMASFKRIT